MKTKETYRDVNSGSTFRIIDINGDDIYYIKMNGRCYAPKVMTRNELINGLRSGNIQKITDPYLNLNPPELTGKALKKSERNWQWIQELWGNYKYELMVQETRSSIIKSFAEEKGCSPSTIRNLLSNFLIKGMDQDSVATNLGKCGSAGKQREVNSKPGPKTGTKSLPTRKLEDIFRKSYKRFYLNSPQATIKEAYDYMVDKFFRENGEIQMQKKPSYQQFRRWIRKQEAEEKITKKYSQNEFDLKHRVLKSSTNADVTGPGDVFEIDATPLDCHIVSRSNRNKLIGRPILYIILDRYSRLIVGMNVGLNGPSWTGAMAALENMVEDKVTYCGRFGIEIDRDEWPVDGIIPYSIIGDRGEMIGRGSNEIIKNLKAIVKNASPYRGDMKANVERSFGTINGRIKRRMDGAVLKEFRKRGDSDPRDKAKLNLDEITRAVIHCVLYYNKHVIENFPLSEDQIAFGVTPQPLSLWNYGVDHYLYSFDEVAAEDFRKSILPTIDRTVNRRGISFKNFCYTAPDSKTESWILNHLGERFAFAYDLEDISEGYLRTPDGEVRLILSDTFASYRGMSFEEASRYDELRREMLDNLEEISLEASIELNGKLDEINKSVPKPDSTVSKAQRKRGIKENRKQERIGISEVTPAEIDKSKIFYVDEQEPLANNYEAIEKVLKNSEKRKS